MLKNDYIAFLSENHLFYLIIFTKQKFHSATQSNDNNEQDAKEQSKKEER